MIKCDFEYHGISVVGGFVRISSIGLDNKYSAVESVHGEEINGKMYQIAVERFTSYEENAKNEPLPGVLYYFVKYEEGVEAMQQCYKQLMTVFKNSVEV